MKQKQILIKSFFTVVFALLVSCNDSKKEKTTINDEISLTESEITENTNQKDSIELSTLVKNVYKFHLEENLDDFPYEYGNALDTIFTGINWDTYNENITKLKKINYFTNTFFISHQNIANTIDTSIKKADIKWRNINNGIPLWSTGADDWCGCQDYPDDYWNLLMIDDLKISDNFASFCWTWDRERSHKYKMTAKKVDNKWFIDSMEGFNHFGTIEDYNTILQESN
ncbi:conserved hypothetical protein [Flavobacterium sp. 9AF]|uniref:hypothetical protein n=1 Tax=Flavobacterium sp. 9AF TaxID=2653142 RepID=UPI0012F1D6F8|nr:hypothetical protein [Flavobacterium sp. 9AF]VXB64131.1 conserved hypothetical protein [Flavobacterium sp. 9AF]